MLKKYRKQNPTIHAIQWKGDNVQEIIAAFNEVKFCLEADNNSLLGIYNLEGKSIANLDDWIVKDHQGNLYPCQDHIFKLVYREESQEDVKQDLHEYLYEDERQLKIKVQSYPFNVRTHLTIETNFGEVRFLWDIPPSQEDRVGDIIHRTYNVLINELYETHQKKGGKFVGDDGCKDYMDANGKTLLIKEPLLMKR